MIKGLLNKLKSQKGFTLLELLVVIAIIAILAAVIIVNLNSARSGANDAKIQSAVQGLSQAFTLYAAQNDPNEFSDQQGIIDGDETSSSVVLSMKNNGILPEIPEHPDSSKTYHFKSNYVNGEVKYVIWGELLSGDNVTRDQCFIALNGATRVGDCSDAEQASVN